MEQCLLFDYGYIRNMENPLLVSPCALYHNESVILATIGSICHIWDSKKLGRRLPPRTHHPHPHAY